MRWFSSWVKETIAMKWAWMQTCCPLPRHSTPGEGKQLRQGRCFKMPPVFMTNELPKQPWRKTWNITASYQQINTQIASAVQLCNSSSLDFHVSPLPLSSFPPLFILEVRVQIHIAPHFTGQDLNYTGFWFCKPKFIATSLFPQAPQASWNTTLMQPQSFCSMCLRRVVGPFFIGPIGSAQDCFRRGVATSEVGVSMSLVLSRSYVLQVLDCIVALVAVLVVNLWMLWTWWQAWKRSWH